MSMNFFFKAFTSDQIDAMIENHDLIDSWILKDESFVDSMDVETAWHVLQTVLKGYGFSAETEIDDALFNGCLIASPDLVNKQAKGLANWSDESLLEAVSQLDPDSDLYHMEVWTDEDNKEGLLEHFNNLKKLFTKAAEKGWGMVLYAA